MRTKLTTEVINSALQKPVLIASQSHADRKTSRQFLYVPYNQQFVVIIRRDGVEHRWTTSQEDLALSYYNQL